MEEDKKKKKNKKKKNKQQNVTTENIAPPDGPRALLVAPSAQNRHVTESGNTSTPLLDETPDAHRESGLPDDPHGTIFAEKIKQFQEEKDAHQHKEEMENVILEEKVQNLLREKDVILQKEATLLERIEELQTKKAAHIQREASLEEQILQLQKEKDVCMHKVNALEKTIAQVQMEKEAHAQKESALEAKVGELLSEKESWFHRESALEAKVGQLLTDKESWFHKEARFEEKINQLMDEAATLSLKKVSLEEMVKQMDRERDSWMLQENSSKEVMAKLNGDNLRLKSQVLELEEVRNSLLQENHLLTENISGLQWQILNLQRTAVVSQSCSDKMHTTENGDVPSQTEAVHALVEKLIAENAQLVAKVNELYVELGRKSLQQETSTADDSPEMAKSVRVADTTAVGLHQMVGATEQQRSPASDSITEAGAKMLVPDTREHSQEGDVNNDVRDEGEHLADKKAMLFPDSSEIIQSDEIVQIPLDENENKPTDAEAANNAQKTEVPLSDAPLIGAPFRLISFVASYVSGADLVEKNFATSGR